MVLDLFITNLYIYHCRYMEKDMFIDAREAKTANFGGRPYNTRTAIRNTLCSLKVGQEIVVEGVIDTFGKKADMVTTQSRIHTSLSGTEVKVVTKKNADGNLVVLRLF